MDDSTFDQLTRTFAVPSRRALFSALGAALFPALFAHDGDDALAKPKRSRGRNHRQDADAVQARGKGNDKKGKRKDNKGKGNDKKGKRNDKKKKKKTCFDKCNGCCDAAGQCAPGNTNTACGTAGYPCDNCAEQGLVCREEQTCGCDVEACKAKAGCCRTAEVCVQGRSVDACGSDGLGCKFCGDGQQCRPVSTGGYGCCSETGAFCGRVDDGIFGTYEVECCGENDSCCRAPGALEGVCCRPDQCNSGQCASSCPHNQKSCANTSDGRTNECLWTVGYNCRGSSGAIAGCGYPGASHCCANTAGSPCGFTIEGEPACPPGATVTPAVTCLD